MAGEALLRVTVVGGDILDTVLMIFSEAGINPVNPVNESTLGNFKTFSYALPIPEDEMIPKRRKLMGELAKESTHLLAMYCHGDWASVYIFKKSAFKR